MPTTAVFFDVDFTLIHPGPTFDGEGYRRFAARYGLGVDPARFAGAVAAASVELDRAQDDIYRPELFVQYAQRVLKEMGGAGSGLEPCAREIYDEWAGCQHFSLYDDVRPAMRALHAPASGSALSPTPIVALPRSRIISSWSRTSAGPCHRLITDS